MSDKEFLDMLDEMIRYPKPVIKLEWVIRLMAMNAEKDQYIKELVLLCLDNGIISRGMACTYLGCAREDLDDILRVVEDGDG